MKHYKVWVQVEEIDENRDHYLDLDLPYEAGCFKTEAAAREFVENELMTTQISGSATDLLEACKVLTSYTSDLLYRLDDQVNLNEIEEVCQAKEAIAKYRLVESLETVNQSIMTLREQSPALPPKVVMIHLLAENGQLWIRPEGYGEKCTDNGEGSPVGMEIWEDHLRLVVFDDIHSEDPQIIDMENARENRRAD